ncbi:acyl-CoA thioesterase II [Sphingomonas sp. NFR15]|uniref:acyl-CoA thioesterase n=1 Tax=Sphingomonas sp. NFR15 TaxID=1566282 RepID=UPI0008867184|nr:acyl-CoA thioesterase II [Sphingomonas sp. NFR15]SDA16124.1 acyl-CoA thioesterase-2 [Sphingomonas sp. NFR15]
MTVPPSADVASELVTLLDVEEIDTDLFRGRRLAGAVGRVFGGQVIAQALQAAQRSTEPPKTAHSLHAYFMRPGNDDYPIVFRVVRDFDGRSFATRRVIATQKGVPILTMTASFQLPEDGLHHQDAMPDVPGPEALRNERQLRGGLAVPEGTPPPAFARAIEVRPVEPALWASPEAGPAVLNIWLRAIGEIGDDPAMHRAVLAYASDLGLITVARSPHPITLFDPRVQGASLDHALWLHEPFRADEWLLYSIQSPWSGHARGLGLGRIFTRDGRLVASSAQEGLMRWRG